MREQQTNQESVLSVFRGHAAHLTATSEKAATREHELNEAIAPASRQLADLTAQIAALGAQATQLERDIAQMVKERDEAAAQGRAAREQGAYAYAVIDLAAKASLTETLTEGELDVRKAGEVAQP